MKASFRSLASLTTALGAFALLVGCSHDRDDEAAATTLTAGAIVRNDDAAMRLANARCDRELACENVGQGKDYADRDACMRHVGHDANATLRADKCPHGVSEANLERCLADTRHERCSNPVDTIERVNACRRGKLCVRD